MPRLRSHAGCVWGVIDGEGPGWAMLGPSLAGLVICDAAEVYFAYRVKTRAAS